MRRHVVILGLAYVSFAFALVFGGMALFDAAGQDGPGLWLAAGSEAVMGVVFLMVARKMRAPSDAWAGPAPPPPVVAASTPEDVDVLLVPEPVLACPHCGYLGIRPLRMGEGGIPGVSEMQDKRVCPRCGYQGLPVEFRTRADYLAFLEDIARPGAGPA